LFFIDYLKYDNATKYQNALETRRNRGSEVRRIKDELDSKTRQDVQALKTDQVECSVISSSRFIGVVN